MLNHEYIFLYSWDNNLKSTKNNNRLMVMIKYKIKMKKNFINNSIFG